MLHSLAVLSAFDLERNEGVETVVKCKLDLPGCLQNANLWERVIEL